jgi:hypothetical protein
MGQSHAVFQDNSILLFVNSQYSLYVGWSLTFKLCIKNMCFFFVEVQILDRNERNSKQSVFEPVAHTECHVIY